MRQTVVGVFDRYETARHAAGLLEDKGIDRDCIHVTGTEAVDADGDGDVRARSELGHEESTGVLSSVKHFFAELFGDEDHDDVSAYSEAVRRGGAVVKVDVEEESDLEAVRDALTAAGAVDIDERVAEWRRAEGTAAQKPEALRDETRGEEDQVIPVLKEEVQIGKRTLQAGGVRVYARTVEEPVQESLQLREERARVESRPVDRPASAADLDAMGERTLEVRESVERPVVQKSARVVEEVVVGKDVRQKTAKVDEKVRRTEVEVQPVAGDVRREAQRDSGASDRLDENAPRNSPRPKA